MTIKTANCYGVHIVQTSRQQNTFRDQTFITNLFLQCTQISYVFLSSNQIELIQIG